MKKYLLCLLALALVLTCAACGPATEEEIPEEEAESPAAAPDDELYIAMLTDAGNIDDQSFNQSCWEAVSKFAEENELEYAYYRPASQSEDALIAAVDAAADEGVDVMVCPGSLFETVIYAMQYEYPEISFLLIDGEPHAADSDVADAAPNVHCVLFQEEQAGFLAGYAAVSEGLTKLGFVGGMEIPAVVRYGYGFIQGADQAAQKKGVQVEINYWYAGSFDPSDDIYRACKDWYDGGTQAIFACGGKLFRSVILAAEEGEKRYVIGVDVDQAPLSDTIITSAMKDLQPTVFDALSALMDNDWVWPDDLAGSTTKLGAEENAVGLPVDDDSWRFQTFTKDDYDGLLADVVDGSLNISAAIGRQPETVNTAVNFIR